MAFIDSLLIAGYPTHPPTVAARSHARPTDLPPGKVRSGGTARQRTSSPLPVIGKQTGESERLLGNRLCLRRDRPTDASIERRNTSLLDRTTYHPTDRPIDRPTDRPTDRSATDRLADRRGERIADRPTDTTGRPMRLDRRKDNDKSRQSKDNIIKTIENQPTKKKETTGRK